MPEADSRISLCRTDSAVASKPCAVPLEIGTGCRKWKLAVWPGMKSRAWTDANRAVAIRTVAIRAVAIRAVSNRDALCS